MKTYLVGGAVRDELLGLEPGERDWVVVGATPQDMLDAGYRQVGRDFPVFLHPETQEEYALARTERKSGRGHHGFDIDASPEVTLEQDLLRRDLTVNAMARDADGQLVDPHGGRRDLEARLLRHVSAAFAEDPLRVLRVARFAARFEAFGFRVADETLELMAAMAAGGELETLPAERVWQETQRALETDAPVRFFELLSACGALDRVLPELAPLFAPHAAAAPAARRAATARSDSPAIRFAALVHPLDDDTLAALGRRLPIAKSWTQCALLAARWHADCVRAGEASAAELWAILAGCDALRRPERFESVLAVCD
ncbi:MAG: multifunctional CCA tRNA nucleotidyl transferase/2'3'-cyclic phosphodiesterase/2'nucleotidase/phosphatase, partial [Halofilum sp. (in: g-proteobacteria)]|nr:multifunctional CCA tRNA nucleotidyl transferase/2'3'-cyclic phosphodiesterase/2'nucleotidase/phosphatase [Halofilum sp. (in: g-proteobacteria)]